MTHEKWRKKRKIVNESGESMICESKSSLAIYDSSLDNDYDVTILLETMAGKGSEIGVNFQEIKKIILQYVKSYNLEVSDSGVNIWMVLGVNGVGKTTSVAKLASYYKNKGIENIILASADTFRAAAIEQLDIHGKNISVRVVSHQHGSDPAAVIFDASSACKAKGSGLVISDTAGRLHNKENLVRELQKIHKVCLDKAGEGLYKRILVLDSTTGQNALRQAEVFNEAVGVDAVILTKYDSTAKGGIAITIGKELNLPVAFICDGEKYENIAPFDAEKYADEFLGL